MKSQSMLRKKRLLWLFGLAGAIILFFLPLIIPEFWVCITTEILILGLAGISLNLLLGYGGSFPFGHAAFYATGAYTAAFLLLNTEIPPFLVLLLSPLSATALGAIFGLLVARLYRFYYAIMTTAFSMLIWTLIRKLPSVTGGELGITGVEVPNILMGIDNTYIFTLIVVLFCMAILWVIVNSSFGLTLRAIRENGVRVGFLGVGIIKHRYLAFLISSFFTGVAGVLHVVYSHNIFPDAAYWVKSADIITVAILGGMFYFIGPLVGACLIILIHTFVNAYTLYWPLVFGIIICTVVLVMPDGVMGLLEKLFATNATDNVPVQKLLKRTAQED